jgi:ribosomally synthesized peptide (two-chain TOMM family)
MEQKGVSDYDTFLNYRAVIIRAAARAWKDHAFREQLLADPKSALKEAFNYDFPYDMDVGVLNNSAAWRPRYDVGWVVHKQNIVSLPLPPKPDDDDEEATALAAYNAEHLTFLTSF